MKQPKDEAARRAEHEEALRFRNEALAAVHTGENCPRDPQKQAGKTAAEAIWTRRMTCHINLGKGNHAYVYEYTCTLCAAKITIGT